MNYLSNEFQTCYPNLRHLHRRLDARTTVRKLLRYQAARQAVQSESTVGLRHVHVHQTELPGPLHQWPGIFATAIKFSRQRLHFVACKVARRLLNVELIIGQLEADAIGRDVV